MLNIITVVNNTEVYNNCLKKSLSRQKNIEYELTVVDNTSNQHSSLYTAYKEATEKSIKVNYYDYFLFCHPDISFENDFELGKLYTEVKKIHEADHMTAVFGVAGETDGETPNGYTTIKQGKNKKKTDSREPGAQGFVPVQTVDACAFFIPREILAEYSFDYENKSFHMLIEEYCLRLKEKGYGIVVIPADIWHLSEGASLDYKYYLETKRIVKKYPKVPYINTTSFHWKNDHLLSTKLSYFAFRNYVHHRILKK